MMKFLKWALILFFALILLLILIAWWMPPKEFDTTVEVDAPVDVTWEFMMDPGRAGDWLDGLQSIKTTRGEPGTVGSRYELVFSENGQKIVFEEEVTHVVSHREFEFTMTNPMFEMEVSMQFEETGEERTLVETHNIVHGKGPFALLVPFIDDEMESRQVSDYTRMAVLIAREHAERSRAADEE